MSSPKLTPRDIAQVRKLNLTPRDILLLQAMNIAVDAEDDPLNQCRVMSEEGLDRLLDSILDRMQRAAAKKRRARK